MSEDNLVALLLAGIAGAVSIMGIAIPAYLNLMAKLKGVAEDSAISRDQLQNDHSTNMREENDVRHSDITDALTVVLDKLNEHGDEIKAVRRDVSSLRDTDKTLRRDFAAHVQESNHRPVVRWFTRGVH